MGLYDSYQAVPAAVYQGQFGLGKGIASTLLGNYNYGATSAAQQQAQQIGMPAPVAYDANAGSGAAAQQQQLNGLLYGRATGQAPMAADANAALQMDAARRNANSVAASAASRGGVNGAMALRSANNAGVDASQQIAGQAGVQRIQEQEGAAGMLGQNLGTTRSQDMSNAQTAAQVALQSGGLNLSAQQVNQQATMQQKQINNQMVQYYTSLGYSLQEAQAAASQAYAQLTSQNANASNAINAGVASQNSQTSGALIGGLLGGIGQVGAAAIGFGSAPGSASAGGGNTFSGANQSGTMNPFA